MFARHLFPTKRHAIVILIFLVFLTLPSGIHGKPVTITASAMPRAGGTITPSGWVPVDYGANFTFNVSPNENYEITHVIVNGVSQGAIDAYTFANLKTGHSMQAKFKVVSHTITVRCEENIEISPSGTIRVDHAKKIGFTVKSLNSDTAPILLVDGTKVGLIKTRKGYKLTLTVTGDHNELPAPQRELILSPATRIVDDITAQTLSSISGERNIFTFKAITPLSQSLRPGDVLVFTIAPLTPYGLLRNVTKVSYIGSQMTFFAGPKLLESLLRRMELKPAHLWSFCRFDKVGQLMGPVAKDAIDVFVLMNLTTDCNV